MTYAHTPRRLEDTSRFPGFRPLAPGRGVFGDPKVRHILSCVGRKTLCGTCGRGHRTFYDHKLRWFRALSCGDTRIYLEVSIRRVWCRTCGKVKREQLAWLANIPLYTKRFAFYVGQRCASAPIRAVARDLHLELAYGQGAGETVYAGAAQARRDAWAKVIGMDVVSIKKGHTYRIVVRHLVRRGPIWFGGTDRSEASMDPFYQWWGPKESRHIRRAVMDMWKAFCPSTRNPNHAPAAAILFDKFHVLRHLGKSLDTVRKQEYARLIGKERAYIKGQKYTLLSHRDNLTLDGRRALKKLLAANKRLHTAYLFKESFSQPTTKEGGQTILRTIKSLAEMATVETV